MALADIVDRAVEAVCHRAEAEGVTVQADLPEDLLVDVDPQRIGQVLRNLLDNALSTFTGPISHGRGPPGGGSRWKARSVEGPSSPSHCRWPEPDLSHQRNWCVRVSSFTLSYSNGGERAVMTALKMMERLEEFNCKQVEKGRPI